MIRAVVDTNVWISALLNAAGPPAELVAAWARGELGAVVPLVVLDEIRDVLGRDRLRRRTGLADQEVSGFVELVAAGSTVVTTTGRKFGCRDPKDDALLEAAILSSADVLVTRDDDLKRDLDLIDTMRREGIAIASVSTLLRLLRS